jgi:hypothetical protein
MEMGWLRGKKPPAVNVEILEQVCGEESLMRSVVATLTTWLALSAAAQAQPSCGDPPRVDDHTLKGDLEGKAKLLSSLVGDTNLKGKIETARTDIFSKYPNAGPARSDAYLEYMFCSFVLTDPKLSAQEKFHAIQEFRQRTAQPAPQASTLGEQSPAVINKGDSTINYGGAAPAPASAPRPPTSDSAPATGSVRTKGDQSPAVNSGGNVGIQYDKPAPVEPPPARAR